MLTAAWVSPAQNGPEFLHMSLATPFATAPTLVHPTTNGRVATRPPKTSRRLVHPSGVVL